MVWVSAVGVGVGVGVVEVGVEVVEAVAAEEGVSGGGMMEVLYY